MTIARGEIYFVNLNPIQGKEQAGTRPVLVLSIDVINQLPLVVMVVVGTKGENIRQDYPTNVRVSTDESGLPLETVFLGFQISPPHQLGNYPKKKCKKLKRQSDIA